MSDFDWKGLIGSVAPTIATALGGPFAGMATKALASKLLGKDDATEAELSTALQSATPEMLAEVKRIDAEFKTKMTELGIDLEKVHAGDRASARDMQVANKTRIVPVLAGLTVAGFFGVVWFVLSGKVALDSTILGFVLGAVSAKAEQVYNFYFGSSAGSKEKTAKLTEMRR